MRDIRLPVRLPRSCDSCERDPTAGRQHGGKATHGPRRLRDLFARPERIRVAGAHNALGGSTRSRPLNRPRLRLQSSRTGAQGRRTAPRGPSPQETRNHRSTGVGNCVPPVASRLRKYSRGDQLGGNRPRDQHESDLTPPRHAVIAPPADPALHPQPQRQSRGNQQEIREVPLPQRRLQGGRHQPAIHGVRRARNQADRIAPVPEVPVARVHSKAAVARPTPNANSVFSRNLMLTSRTASAAHGWQGGVASGTFSTIYHCSRCARTAAREASRCPFVSSGPVAWVH